MTIPCNYYKDLEKEFKLEGFPYFYVRFGNKPTKEFQKLRQSHCDIGQGLGSLPKKIYLKKQTVYAFSSHLK